MTVLGKRYCKKVNPLNAATIYMVMLNFRLLWQPYICFMCFPREAKKLISANEARPPLLTDHRLERQEEVVLIRGCHQWAEGCQTQSFFSPTGNKCSPYLTSGRSNCFILSRLWVLWHSELWCVVSTKWLQTSRNGLLCYYFHVQRVTKETRKSNKQKGLM